MAGKRGNGEGSISYSKKRDEYIGMIRDGHKPDGSPNRVYFYSGKGGKRGDVVKQMQEWRLARQEGYADENKVALDDGMKLWLTTIKKPELKPASYDRLESITDTQVSPRIGEYDIKKLTDVIIKNELLDPIIKDGLSYSTLKKAYDAVHAYLKYAVYKKLIRSDPMAMLKIPKLNMQTDARETGRGKLLKEEGQVETLSDVEIMKLYSASSLLWASTKEKRFPMTPAYIFILNTGLRMGEALALLWTDVDLKTKTISITKNLIVVKDRDPEAKPKYKLIIQNTPKSAKSRRTVPLNDDAIAALEALQNHPGTTSTGYVIHTKSGAPIRPRNFQNTLNSITSAVGMREITLHPLRHTYATKLFEAGVDVKIISELLGHSSTEITYRIYIHVIEKLKREAVSKAYNIMPKA